MSVSVFAESSSYCHPIFLIPIKTRPIFLMLFHFCIHFFGICKTSQVLQYVFTYHYTPLAIAWRLIHGLSVVDDETVLMIYFKTSRYLYYYLSNSTDKLKLSRMCGNLRLTIRFVQYTQWLISVHIMYKFRWQTITFLYTLVFLVPDKNHRSIQYSTEKKRYTYFFLLSCEVICADKVKKYLRSGFNQRKA